MPATAIDPAPAALSKLELEITGLCQLRCAQCYADSGPHGGHGTMTAGDWESVITQAAAIGVQAVQFIGGEPTLSPDLPGLARHALAAGLRVSVYSNLVRVTDDLWELFATPGVALATSWYAADPATHAVITGSRTAYAATRASIARAVGLGIPLRAAVITVQPGQDTAAAEAELRALGVTRVSVHATRGLGRAARDGHGSDPAELCGHCGAGRAAILPDGQFTPCVMGRWLKCGNVRDTPIAAILAGDAWRQAMTVIPRQGTACTPDSDGESCAPDQECAPASNKRRAASLVPAVQAG